MNEFLILLENAAGAGRIVLGAVAVAAIAMLIHDLLASRNATAERSEQERKAA